MTLSGRKLEKGFCLVHIVLMLYQSGSTQMYWANNGLSGSNHLGQGSASRGQYRTDVLPWR